MFCTALLFFWGNISQILVLHKMNEHESDFPQMFLCILEKKENKHSLPTFIDPTPRVDV